MKNIRKFITRYKGVELARDKYYGWTVRPLFIESMAKNERGDV